MAKVNESLPVMDDIPVPADNGQTEQELLDAVLANSEFIQETQESLPDREIPKDDPTDLDGEDPAESEEVVNEESEEIEDTEEEEAINEDAEEDSSATQYSEAFTSDDLDLEAKILVKIDGEETPVTFGDLLKGYTTEQSLSAKGRELGEARKQLETEKEQQLAEISKLGQASAAILYQEEQVLAKQYHDIEKSIKEARESGDTYELSELKDKREEAQEEYWSARNKRESIVTALDAEQKKISEKVIQEKFNKFYDNIQELIPDYNEEVSKQINEFAINEGIPEEIIKSLVSPEVAKFVNDYRLLKVGVTKGEAKRKQVVTKRVPVKKVKSSQTKKANKESMIKARAFKEDASKDEQMAFLKQLASRSLNQ